MAAIYLLFRPTMLPLVLDDRVRLSGEAQVVELVPNLAIIEIKVDRNNKFDNFGTVTRLDY